ncbi:hypothetical protein NLI96_g934 [Meripilus lineatus]|uniref:Uncharacterized protein n=1 Tax=Meripilus lineatus TaxID=2056292 RepID=A0AAD5YLJ2_9APHY|nr:hypothetical protein NLI96_g934 [Physisporinus lineatus]
MVLLRRFRNRTLQEETCRARGMRLPYEWSAYYSTSRAGCAFFSTRIGALEEDKARSSREYEDRIGEIEGEMDESSAQLALARLDVSQRTAAL